MSDEPEKVVIHGVTRAGRKFRPSDWAQRLTTAVAAYGSQRRIRFHPKVRMASIDGINCVVFDADLADTEPMLYDFLMGFARGNDLQLTEEHKEELERELA